MKTKRKANLDEDKIQEKKDKGVEMLRRFGDDDAADKLDDESLESYALRKGIRVDNPRKRTAKKKPARKAARSKKVVRRNSATTDAIDSIDKKISGIRRRLRRLERIDISSASSWQAAWDKHPDLAAREKELFKRRGELQTKRNANRKRNAFGLDRFFGRKSRVTSSDWNRAGEARRAQALRAAGVSKKLLPVYTDMSWRDMQALEPSFITKVMASLPARKNARRRARNSEPRGERRRTKTRKQAFNAEVSKKIWALRAEGMSQKQAIAAALNMVRSGHTKSGKYKRGPRRNPDALARASETYAMFHGRGPKDVVTVKQLEGDPKTMTALGDLQYFVVVPGGDESAAYKVAWGAGDKRPFLATNHQATQLYVVGGNQNVDEMLRKMGVTSSAQDLLDLGEVREVEYYTQKAFDNFTPIRYFHHFGEEDAKRNPRRVRRPRLIYSRRNKKLMLAGGGYKIKKDGIIN